MSRLNSKTSSLTQGNVNTHIFTEFSNNATEDTQKQVLQAITNLGTGGGGIATAVIDEGTHNRLDEINTSILNQEFVLDKTTSSIDISGQTIDVNVLTDVSIIKGKDLQTENPIEITADSKSTGGAEPEIVNRLYTHASLYGESTDGFGVKSDIALSCDEGGILNVNVVGADTFNGVIKGISVGAGNPAVNISADSFTPPAGNPINKLYTRSSLFGTNEMGDQEYAVRVNPDGQVSVVVENPNPLQTVVSNDIIVSPIVQKQTFSLELNADLYADSTGDFNPPFRRDNRGHQGWYYVNGNPANSSNVYYYSNIPAFPLTLQNDILLSDINFFYAVITIDFVGTSPNNLPFLVMGSQALGTNDHIPGFANTVYAYTLPAENTYIAGEPIVIYWSDSLNKKPLDTFMPNLRRVKCNNPTITGTGESTKLAYFSINTATLVQQKQEYTLIGAGYKFNNTGGEQGGLINDTTFDFLFTANTVIENNLAKLTFNESNELLVVGTGGGGGVVQGIDTDSGDAVNINATDNKLLVIVSSLPVSGSYGNVAFNITLTTGASTDAFNLTSGNYKKDCILTVEDTSILETGYYIIIASSDGGTNYENLGIIQPITYITGNRGNSTTLNLTPYNRLVLINGGGNQYVGVKISLYST